MKKTKVILIAVLAAFVTLMTVSLCTALTSGGIFWGNFTSRIVTDRCTLLNTREIDMADVSGLTVDYTGTGYDVYFVPGEGPSIIMEEYFTAEENEELYAVVTNTGGAVNIRGQGQRQIFGQMITGYVKLYLPLAIYGQLQNFSVLNTSGNVELSFEENSRSWASYQQTAILNLSTTSGNIDISGIKSQNASVNANSGNITIDWLQATDADVNATSGNVKFKSFAGSGLKVSCNSGNIEIGTCEGRLELNTTSGTKYVESCKGDLLAYGNSSNTKIGSCDGNIEVENSSGDVSVADCSGDVTVGLTSGNIKLGTVLGSVHATSSSGNINVENLQNACSAKSSSGTIHVNVTAFNGDIHLQGTSGGTRLTLPEDSSFYFEAETTSGGIRTYFDDSLNFNQKGNVAQGTVGENPKHTVSCSFSSGSVTVRDSAISSDIH